MRKLADDEQRELLQEVLTSPGWSVFCNKVLSEVLSGHTKALFDAARASESTDYIIGKYDGVIELLKSAHEAANLELPQYFDKLRRNGA